MAVCWVLLECCRVRGVLAKDVDATAREVLSRREVGGLGIGCWAVTKTRRHDQVGRGSASATAKGFGNKPRERRCCGLAHYWAWEWFQKGGLRGEVLGHGMERPVAQRHRGGGGVQPAATEGASRKEGISTVECPRSDDGAFAGEGRLAAAHKR